MAEPALMRFADHDQFLRRVRFHNHVKLNRDEVRWNAFKDKDPQMSWTYRDESLRTEAGVDEYHQYWSERVEESLPAILWFTFAGLTKKIDPPLEPRHNPDHDDRKYGHLHCSTDPPGDKPHMQLLAKLVNDGQHAGIVKRWPKDHK